MNNLVKLLLVSLISAAGSVYADPQLLQLTVADSSGDSSVFNGTFTGGLGSVSTGVSFFNLGHGWQVEIAGGDTGTAMDLDTLDIITSGSGSLTVTLSGTDFTLNTGNEVSSVGGTAMGGVNFSTFGDASDGLNIETTLLSSISISNPHGAFSGSQGGSTAILGSTYSLTEVITLTNPTPGTFNSIDGTLNTVPDTGATLLLVGLGLGGLAIGARKFRTVKA